MFFVTTFYIVQCSLEQVSHWYTGQNHRQVINDSSNNSYEFHGLLFSCKFIYRTLYRGMASRRLASDGRKVMVAFN